jgi:hypothetical protein
MGQAARAGEIPRVRGYTAARLACGILSPADVVGDARLSDVLAMRLGHGRRPITSWRAQRNWRLGLELPRARSP